MNPQAKQPTNQKRRVHRSSWKRAKWSLKTSAGLQYNDTSHPALSSCLPLDRIWCFPGRGQKDTKLTPVAHHLSALHWYTVYRAGNTQLSNPPSSASRASLNLKKERNWDGWMGGWMDKLLLGRWSGASACCAYVTEPSPDGKKHCGEDLETSGDDNTHESGRVGQGDGEGDTGICPRSINGCQVYKQGL